MALYARFNVLMDFGHFLRVQALFIKPLQVGPVSLSHMQMPGMLRKINQHGAVPEQRAVLCVKNTTTDVQTVQYGSNGFEQG